MLALFVGYVMFAFEMQCTSKRWNLAGVRATVFAVKCQFTAWLVEKEIDEYALSENPSLKRMDHNLDLL